jgi:hypothetical protein
MGDVFLLPFGSHIASFWRNRDDELSRCGSIEPRLFWHGVRETHDADVLLPGMEGETVCASIEKTGE